MLTAHALKREEPLRIHQISACKHHKEGQVCPSEPLLEVFVAIFNTQVPVYTSCVHLWFDKKGCSNFRYFHYPHGTHTGILDKMPDFISRNPKQHLSSNTYSMHSSSRQDKTSLKVPSSFRESSHLTSSSHLSWPDASRKHFCSHSSQCDHHQRWRILLGHTLKGFK